MSTFNMVASMNESTVVAEYTPQTKRSDSYQSEAELEKEFIHMLCEQGYEYLQIHEETELIANLFRISQTEEKIRKDQVQGADEATTVHYNVGKEVRTAIEKIGGTMPEDLPTPEKSIQQIEKEHLDRLRAKAKSGQLMLDE